MELCFRETKKPGLFPRLRPALLFAALWCATLAAVQLLHSLPFAMIGLVPLLILSFLPKKARRMAAATLLVLSLGFFAIRFASVLNGLKMLANQVFSISESCQAYEYDYFSVTDSAASLREGLVFVSLLTALAVFLGGGPALTVLLWTAQAYFGVTPPGLWLALLFLAAALYFMPEKGLWLHGLLAVLLTGLISLCVFFLAPGTSVSLSGAEETARDRLAIHSIFYEQIPELIETPEPETEPPDVQALEPNRAVEENEINVLFYALVLLTLLLLFVPAVFRDRARKKREKNRAGFADPDCAAAIRAMYLHSRKWLQLMPVETPRDIRDLWLEAAYSDHTLTQAQRARMEEYLARVEQTAWEAAGKRERLRIRYRLCL